MSLTVCRADVLEDQGGINKLMQSWQPAKISIRYADDKAHGVMSFQAARRRSVQVAWLVCRDIQAAGFTTTAAVHGTNAPLPPARPPPVRPRSPRRPGPPAVAPQHWVEVVDEASGQIYYWNKSTGCGLMPRILSAASP